MKHFYLIILTLLLVACGDEEQFTIDCDIKGLGSKGVEMVYYNKGYRKVTFHPVDNKVRLKGDSPDLTMVDLFTLDGDLIFTCVAKNGEELEVKMTLDDPASLRIKGNKPSEQYSEFLSANSDVLNSRSPHDINALLTEEISAHPDRISSTMLLITRFYTPGYEMLADSLLNVLAVEARPAGLSRSYSSMVGEQVSATARGDVKPITIHSGRDTIAKFTPSFQSYGLLAFVSARKPDSITSKLRALYDDMASKRFKLLEISLQTDSLTWRTAISGDNAKWMQAWVPGGSGAQQIRNLAIPRTPYFIVTDSTGSQIYRGSSISMADTILRSHMRPEPSQPDSVVAQPTDSLNTIKPANTTL